MTYNFPPHTKGDTFPGRTFEIKIKTDPADITDGAPLDLTNASIRMQLRMSPTHPVSHELSTDNDMIIIDHNPLLGVFQVKEQIIDFPANNYVYDIEISWTSGKVKTYISGTWLIIQDITH